LHGSGDRGIKMCAEFTSCLVLLFQRVLRCREQEEKCEHRGNQGSYHEGPLIHGKKLVHPLEHTIHEAHNWPNEQVYIYVVPRHLTLQYRHAPKCAVYVCAYTHRNTNDVHTQMSMWAVNYTDNMDRHRCTPIEAILKQTTQNVRHTSTQVYTSVEI
jgi:hypothetical protein